MKFNNSDYDKELLSEYKKRVLGILIDFDKFLKKNGIKYVLSDGSALGAVRHHGFIPWDDDIDITLEKKEYEKLLKIIEEFNSEKYEVVLPLSKGPLSAGCMIKIYDKHTAIKERECNSYEGAFIDIFTTFDMNSSFFTKIRLLKYRFYLTIYYLKCKRINLNNYNSKFIILAKPFSKLINIDKVVNKLQYFYTHEFSKGKECNWSFGTYHPLKKEYFLDTIDWPFEGYYFPIPKKYDEYLTLEYGDYMKFPPKEKQVAHHLEYLSLDKSYINMNQKSINKTN